MFTINYRAAIAVLTQHGFHVTRWDAKRFHVYAPNGSAVFGYRGDLIRLAATRVSEKEARRALLTVRAVNKIAGGKIRRPACKSTARKPRRDDRTPAERLLADAEYSDPFADDEKG